MRCAQSADFLWVIVVLIGALVTIVAIFVFNFGGVGNEPFIEKLTNFLTSFFNR